MWTPRPTCGQAAIALLATFVLASAAPAVGVAGAVGGPSGADETTAADTATLDDRYAAQEGTPTTVRTDGEGRFETTFRSGS